MNPRYKNRIQQEIGLVKKIQTETVLEMRNSTSQMKNLSENFQQENQACKKQNW